jgi:diguanylate cyclase (GGDEF)-like protein/PAS domain S-box-containing protein
MSAKARLGNIPRVPGPAGVRRGTVGPDRNGALESLVDFLDAFLWEADPATLIVGFVSKSARDVLGHPLARWLGAPEQWREIIHADDRDRVVECLRATANDGEDREVEFRARAADGREMVLRHAVRLLTDSSGNPELWGMTTNITADRRAKEKLRETRERYRALSAKAAKFRRQALEDPLTGLPNRILLDDRLGTALRAAERSGEPCAVLMMDLDNFKKINDTQGHHAGDEVLRQVALRLKIALRAQDTPARLGGDEFAAVLPNTAADGAIRTAERVLRALDGIGVSIGVAVSPAHGKEAEELLEHADTAMYRAKHGRGGYVMYGSEGDARRGISRGLRGRFLTPGRRAMIGLGVTLAVLAGSMAHTGGQLFVLDDSATRLAAAVIALERASVDQVGTAVGDVEIAVAEISWKDVGRAKVVTALDSLERSLVKLRKTATTSIATRVNHLIATVQQAQVVAAAADDIPQETIPTPEPNLPEAAVGVAQEVPDSGPTP